MHQHSSKKRRFQQQSQELLPQPQELLPQPQELPPIELPQPQQQIRTMKIMIHQQSKPLPQKLLHIINSSC